ncbi:NfeD family protein [Psychromicrobium sp. YIM B11713]|uniref:NfeD family protein n=1 Tax=Psychromicrobium sp. YIM B11713 TaxID=3145233 RepID=UPI00374E94CA
MFEWLFENGWALWLIVFLILAGIEILTLDLFFILMSVGAFASLVSYFLGAPLWLQVVIFCVVALAMILFVRPIALRHLHKGPHDLRTNVDRLIGHPATVVEPVSVESGLVKIGGDTWSAKLRGGGALPVGSSVIVTEIDGATAIVAAVPAAPTQGYPAAPAGL